MHIRWLAILSAALFLSSVSFAQTSVRTVETPVESSPGKTGIVLKTNVLSLPILVLNAGAEIQPFPHWSLSIPVYYSGLNWMSQNRKFRTLAFQPEVRYWLGDTFRGLFFNVHAVFGWYNVALGGDYRYQDHAHKSPTFGGGLGVGYKLALGTTRWGLEFGLGAGVLPLHYDYYYNIPNGRLAGEDTYTYWGPDQAFLSLTYTIVKRDNRTRK